MCDCCKGDTRTVYPIEIVRLEKLALTAKEAAAVSGLTERVIKESIRGEHKHYPRLRAIWKNPNADNPHYLIRVSDLDKWLDRLANL